jgi:hypothetical protein
MNTEEPGATTVRGRGDADTTMKLKLREYQPED